MKHLKLYEGFNYDSDKSLSESIDSICKRFNIENWTQNSDGSIDVIGDVKLSNRGLKEIPIKFGEVTGDFYCSKNQLTSLEGTPKKVGGNFWCRLNKLTSLEGAPSEVGGTFDCNGNELVTLKGGPSYVGVYFDCSNNELITLEGGPKELGGGILTCYVNPICNIYKLFPDYKSYLESQDYGYLRGRSIDKGRFKEALDELGIQMPDKIEGWKWI